jgi:hypothetical protein
VQSTARRFLTAARAALAANPEMPLDELRLRFEHWGDVTAEHRTAAGSGAPLALLAALWLLGRVSCLISAGCRLG